MAHSVVLADDLQIIRDGLRLILDHLGDFQVVGEVDDVRAAVEIVKRLKPEIFLTELTLRQVAIAESSAELARISPDTKLVILSAREDDESAITAIRAGAKGYVVKNTPMSELGDALRVIARGGSYLSTQISDKLLTRIQRGNIDSPNASPLDILSPREIQVLRLVAEGKTSKDIALMLDLGLQTIRSYRKTLMKKLGVTNVATLTQLALSSGLSTGQTKRGRGEPKS